MSFAVRYRFVGDDGNAYKNCIDGDGKGYYAYLPAVFIYHDLSFSFFQKNMTHLGNQYGNSFILNHNGKNVNKYTCGEAILLLPFFLLATLYSWLFHIPIDGYNRIYHLYCAIGSLFYGIFGLFYVKKFLQKYALSNLAIALGLTAIALGTNMLNYMIHEISMSHIFSFAMIAWHVFMVKKYVDAPAVKTSFLIGLTLGLIILIRPVNGMIIFSYPFLMSGNFIHLKKKKTIVHLLIMVGFALSVISIQLIIWKIQTGNFLVYSYKNEGFYFNNPQIYNYLFSFKRGAFIYSPVLFFSFISIFALCKRSIKECILIILFLLFVIYIHSSWWSWYYGDGFGERPLVDFYIFFAFLIAIFFNGLSKLYLRISAITLFAAAVIFHLVFFYQYYYGILHPDSMNFEKFKYVFLKTDKKYANLFKCNPDDFYHPKGIRIVDSVYINFTERPVAQSRFAFDQNKLSEKGYKLSNEQNSIGILFITDSNSINKTRFVEFYSEYLEPKNDSAACGTFFGVALNDNGDKTNLYFKSSVIAERYNHISNKYISSFERFYIQPSRVIGNKIHIFIANSWQRDIFIKTLKIRIVEAAPY